MITLRTDEGAVKCAFLDLRRSEATIYAGIREGLDWVERKPLLRDEYES